MDDLGFGVERLVASLRPVPAKAGLAALITSWSGANHRAEMKSSAPLVLTHHAAVRLAMRSGARTVKI